MTEDNMASSAPAGGAGPILRRLNKGPATNAELQDAAQTHSGDVARTCAKLIASGRIVRVDGGGGRGSTAIYALAPHDTGTVNAGPGRPETPSIPRSVKP